MARPKQLRISDEERDRLAKAKKADGLEELSHAAYIMVLLNLRERKGLRLEDVTAVETDS